MDGGEGARGNGGTLERSADASFRLLAAALALSVVACDDGAGEGAAPIVSSSKGAATDELEPQRPEFEAAARAIFASENDLLSRSAAPRMKALLDSGRLEGGQLYQGEMAYAQRLLQDGDIDAATAIYERLRADAKAGTKRHLDVTRALGIAFLRRAEVKNCVARHVADCCIFPIAGGGVHTDKEPARRALACFLEFLETKPDHLPTRWLANVTALALGEHPDALPEGQVIPLDAFASEHEVPRFVDVAPELAVDTFNLCGGVAIEDFDRDGRLDILTSTYDPMESLTFYRANGAGGYVDATEASRASDQLGGLNLISADYDGDGDADVLVLRGAWLTNDGRVRNSLLRNDGGVFVDVTRAAGVAEPAMPTQAAAFGDFDGDGDLDLYVANETTEGDPNQAFPCQLFRNEGDGTFTDVAREAGVTNDRYAKGVTVGDYDDDGDLDLYVSNFGANRLYRNDGAQDGRMRFTDVAPALGVTEPEGRSFATWFFDYDNDGALDLFVTSYVGGSGDLVASTLRMEREWPRPRLYHNEGGTFREVGVELGLDRFFMPMGANFGDLDADGYLDVYLTTGDPSLESIHPNAMLRNDGGERFQDVTTAGGFGHLQKGHGIAFADLDDDGDQDLYHQLGGFYPGDRFHNALFRNPGNGNRMLIVELEGTRSNRQGIGARIEVRVTASSGAKRSIHRAVGSVSSFGGSPMRQEIGLGDATSIDELIVQWPNGGERQVFTGIEPGAAVRVVEGEAAPRAPAAKSARANRGE